MDFEHHISKIAHTHDHMMPSDFG